MEQKIRSLIKQAMISKNENAKSTYKSILENGLKIAKNDGNRAATDDDFIKAAKNEIKQLNDLYEYVKDDSKKATEIAEKVGYCQELLPKMVSEEEILGYLNSNNIEKNIGACMKALKAQFGSALDGKSAQQVVKTYIG
ncbi:MAG: GatB/YqeY domain-containing protein [Lachnospiraceae bacterium]|nr:GatB/YqeY domain-containing protein [Lachnospiraceae bacterium]